jgi:hypothetical protein
MQTDYYRYSFREQTGVYGKFLEKPAHELLFRCLRPPFDTVENRGRDRDFTDCTQKFPEGQKQNWFFFVMNNSMGSGHVLDFPYSFRSFFWSHSPPLSFEVWLTL